MQYAKTDFSININKFFKENQGKIEVLSIRPIVLRHDVKICAVYKTIAEKNNKVYSIKKVFPEQWKKFHEVHQSDINIIEPYSKGQRQKFGYFVLLKSENELKKDSNIETVYIEDKKNVETIIEASKDIEVETNKACILDNTDNEINEYIEAGINNLGIVEAINKEYTEDIQSDDEESTTHIEELDNEDESVEPKEEKQPENNVNKKHNKKKKSRKR